MQLERSQSGTMLTGPTPRCTARRRVCFGEQSRSEPHFSHAHLLCRLQTWSQRLLWGSLVSACCPLLSGMFLMCPVQPMLPGLWPVCTQPSLIASQWQAAGYGRRLGSEATSWHSPQGSCQLLCGTAASWATNPARPLLAATTPEAAMQVEQEKACGDLARYCPHSSPENTPGQRAVQGACKANAAAHSGPNL